MKKKNEIWIRVKTEEQLEEALKAELADFIIVGMKLQKKALEICVSNNYERKIRDEEGLNEEDEKVGALKKGDESVDCKKENIKIFLELPDVVRESQLDEMKKRLSKLLDVVEDVTRSKFGKIANTKTVGIKAMKSCQPTSDAEACNYKEISETKNCNCEELSGLEKCNCEETCKAEINNYEKCGKENVENRPVFSGVCVKNIDELGILNELGYKGKVVADSFLYSCNKEAIDFYRSVFEDIDFIAPVELTLKELKKLEHDADVDFIYKAYGYQQLMITTQCFSGAYFRCSKPKLVLKDEAGGNFIATSECESCYDTIHNGLPTFMLDKLSEFRKQGYFEIKTGRTEEPDDIFKEKNYIGKAPENNNEVDESISNMKDIEIDLAEENQGASLRILLDFTVEDKFETMKILQLAKQAIETGNCNVPEKYTRGHYYSGVE